MNKPSSTSGRIQHPICKAPESKPTAKAVERRLRRYLRGETQHLFAVCAPGMERVLEKEIAALPEATEIKVEEGGVSFQGHLKLVRDANLRLETAGRILLRIASFPANSKEEFRERLKRIPWELYLSDERGFSVRAVSKKSKLIHTGLIEDLASLAIKDRCPWMFRGESGFQEIRIRMEGDFAMVSLDTSGVHLHKRGYGEKKGDAPIRETIAAGVLLHFFPEIRGPFLDPVCGSGTILLEAARRKAGLPAGFKRSFAFEIAPYSILFSPVDRSSFHATFQEGDQFVGSDIDEKILRAARDNLNEISGGEPWPVHFAVADFQTMKNEFESTGQIVANPPYGKRLPGGSPFLASFLEKLRKEFRGWEAVVIVPEELTPLPGFSKHSDVDILTFPNGSIPTLAVRIKL